MTKKTRKLLIKIVKNEIEAENEGLDSCLHYASEYLHTASIRSKRVSKLRKALKELRDESK